MQREMIKIKSFQSKLFYFFSSLSHKRVTDPTYSQRDHELQVARKGTMILKESLHSTVITRQWPQN